MRGCFLKVALRKTVDCLDKYNKCVLNLNIHIKFDQLICRIGVQVLGLKQRSVTLLQTSPESTFSMPSFHRGTAQP